MRVGGRRVALVCRIGAARMNRTVVDTELPRVSGDRELNVGPADFDLPTWPGRRRPVPTSRAAGATTTRRGR